MYTKGNFDTRDLQTRQNYADFIANNFSWISQGHFHKMTKKLTNIHVKYMEIDDTLIVV